MRLLKSFLLSTLLHAALFGAAIGFIAWRDAHAERSIDIDLTGRSLLMRPKNEGGRSRPAAPPQPWILASGRRYAPPPKAEPVTATAQVEEVAAPCPPPCPEAAGDWIPAAAATRRPDWVEGLITEDDYPRELRRQGKQGRVVVDVLIDATGAVRGVTLVQGSEPQFNELVLARLKESRFRPAYNNDGNAVPSKLRMPIVFELR